MKQYMFLTLNDFSQDDGGTIRMRGIMNALAESGQSVRLLSNTVLHYKFHHTIDHVFLDYQVSKRKKQFFQLSLTLLPRVINKYIFKNFLLKIKSIIQENNIDNSSIIFFEYLDNSVGYFLKQNGLLENYINDLHGIAPLEFKLKKTTTLFERFINYVKFKLVLMLDQKVITNASELLFLSTAMKVYYETLYPSIKKHTNKVLRDGVSKELCSQNIDKKQVQVLRRKYNIDENLKVILFLGDFKDLGGVIDLIEAFKLLLDKEKISRLRLLLVGSGERFLDAQILVKKYSLEDKVLFAGRIDYTEVRNYQELANVIVCPDKQHQFSELIPHIKYFDAITSGKIVINGSFASVQEINISQMYSIDFKPSDIFNLADKIEYVFQNLDYLQSKYSYNPKTACAFLSYNQTIQVLLD